MGSFMVRVNLPGRALAGHDDHGCGPLALIGESFLNPGTHVSLHEHRDDEIISYVPEGVMRHGDPTVGVLAIDRDHLMVMNAGAGFSHEERTLEDDPPLRMLQIFVRPRAAGLPPKVQHGPVPRREPNAWRHLVGPEGGPAPFFVRNRVDILDIRLAANASVPIPEVRGWQTYLFVFEGEIELAGERFRESESCLVPEPWGLRASALRESSVLAFRIDPRAPITREGTIGR